MKKETRTERLVRLEKQLEHSIAKSKEAGNSDSEYWLTAAKHSISRTLVRDDEIEVLIKSGEKKSENS